MTSTYAEDYAALIDYLNTRDVEQRRRKKHRLPVERYSRCDGEFFFTLCARHVGEPFRDTALAEAVVQALLWRRRQHGWDLPCYCLMPDHLHFMVKLPISENRTMNGGTRGMVLEGVLDQVARFKRYTTTQVWWKSNGSGSLWQRSSYDRVLRYDQVLDAVAHYVLNNPVRKGLVERWQDYPHSGIEDPW